MTVAASAARRVRSTLFVDESTPEVRAFVQAKLRRGWSSSPPAYWV